MFRSISRPTKAEANNQSSPSPLVSQAKLIKSIILPDHVENGDDLYIQVLAVQPEPDKSLPVFNPTVAKEIRTYYETS